MAKYYNTNSVVNYLQTGKVESFKVTKVEVLGFNEGVRGNFTPLGFKELWKLYKQYQLTQKKKVEKRKWNY